MNIRLRYFLMTSLFAIRLSTNAQVLISPQLPPVGITAKNELWNLSLVNSFPYDVEVQLEVYLTDLANNQRVLSAISRRFMLPRGAKNIRANDILPVFFTVLNNGYNIDGNPNGFLPVGNFNVCYTVIRFDHASADRISEECETIEVEPMSPPMLVIPEDLAEIESSRPLFSWIPPSPSSQFSNLYYDWTLVEVLATQSGMDAVQLNIPVLSRHNLTSASFQYPLSFPELDTAKTYAWQIKVNNNGYSISNSEVWTFRIKSRNSTVPELRKVFFTRLGKEEHDVYTVCYGQLGFEFNNELNDSLITIEIIDITRPKKKKVEVESTALDVTYGINYKFIDLSENREMIDKHIYLLKVANSKNENWFIKFEYRKSE